jgi:hypothetical protein
MLYLTPKQDDFKKSLNCKSASPRRCMTLSRSCQTLVLYQRKKSGLYVIRSFPT